MSEDAPLMGYCFKCKDKREMLEPKAEWSASGAPGTRATCPVCGGTIYKMGRTPAHENLPKPEIIARPKQKGKKAKAKKTTSKKTATKQTKQRQTWPALIRCPSRSSCRSCRATAAAPNSLARTSARRSH